MPASKSNYVYLGLTFVRKKLYTNAIEAFSKLPSVPFDQGNNGLLYLSYTYAMAGDTIKAKEILNKVSKEDRLKSPGVVALVNVALRHTDEAMTQLENAYTEHALHMVFLKVDPALDPIRNEPRFKDVMKKMRMDL